MTGAPREPRDAPATPDVHVEFAGVSKSYDGRTLVVEDLDLQIRTGEFVTLLGPSGRARPRS